RRSKERAMHDKFSRRIEEALERLAARIVRSKKRLDPATVNRQIGRILQQNQRAAARFAVELVADPCSAGFRLQVACNAAFDDWAALSQGAYLLRSNITDWSDQQLWKAYIQLTQAEAAFRSPTPPRPHSSTASASPCPSACASPNQTCQLSRSAPDYTWSKCSANFLAKLLICLEQSVDFAQVGLRSRSRVNPRSDARGRHHGCVEGGAAAAPHRCSIAARTRATVSAGVRATCSTSAATCSPVSGSTSILSRSAS